MRYNFRLKSTPAALAAMGARKQRIITDIVREVETLDLGDKDYAIFDVHDLGLKAVVQFSKKEMHVMTVAEYTQANLPDRPAQSGAHRDANEGLAMLRPFTFICSDIAAAALSRDECREIFQRVLPMAREKDRGVHEGLTFSFDMHGEQWNAVVDLQQGWVKFLRKDELDKGMAAAIQAN